MCLRASVKGAADSVFQGLIFIFFKPGGGKQSDRPVSVQQTVTAVVGVLKLIHRSNLCFLLEASEKLHLDY